MRSLIAVLFIALVFGCATIVKKPEITKVKKVAIVSLYANERIPNKSGGGEVKGWDKIVRDNVGQQMLEIYEEAFKREDEMESRAQYQDFKIENL